MDQTETTQSLQSLDAAFMLAAGIEDGDGASQLDTVEEIDPAELETNPYAESEAPYGLLGYRIEVTQPGDGVTVSVQVSPTIDPQETQWVCYNSVDGWRDCTDSTVATQDGYSVDRYIVDGGIYDADGTANGTIVEISGPTVSSTNGSSLAVSDGNESVSTDGSSASCFIMSMF
jgi:hypothetical protein